MGNMLEFFGNLLEEETWRRAFFVALGAMLIYLSLMSGQNRVASFFGR